MALSRTSIFSDFVTYKPKFREDFEAFLDLAPEQKCALIPFVLELLAAETTDETEKIRARIPGEIEGTLTELLSALNVLHFMATEWNAIRDTPEAFLKDLESVDLLKDDRRDEGRAFFAEFLKHLADDRKRRLDKLFAHSLLPSYGGMTTLIDLRAVFDNPYGQTDLETVSAYSPRCTNWVPVVLVKILRDRGTPTTFEFQCEESQVRRMIDHLTAALKDLKAAESELRK